MKYLVGSAVSILLMIVLAVVNAPPFFIGWISCMGYYLGLIYSEALINKKQ